MTLKEKFAKVLWSYAEEGIIPQIEKISDNHAIGFAEWLEINKQDINYSKNHNTKELLEIYKSELGL
jgi:hypothetical protein